MTNRQLFSDEFKKLKEWVRNFYPNLGPNVNKINILMFGYMGAGKSSFINTAETAVGERFLKKQYAIPSASSVTLKLCKVPLTDTIYLWDVWGYENKDSFSEVFSLLMMGMLPDGHEHGRGMPMQLKSSLEERVHAVILVIDGGQSIRVAEHLRLLRNYYERISIAPFSCVWHRHRFSDCF